MQNSALPLILFACACAAGCSGSDTSPPGGDDLSMTGGGDDLSMTGGGHDLSTSGGNHDLSTSGGNHDLSTGGGNQDLSFVGSTDLGHTGNAIQTVFIILMENSNWSGIKGSTSMPYLNNMILPIAAHAEMYKNPPSLHPSEPNYLWLEAGTNFNITADGLPSGDHQSSTAHLVTQLNAAGISWKSYQEDIDGTTCPLSVVKEYVPRHNPMVYFDDVTGTNDPNNSYCINHVRPFSELATDLTNNTVARYNFITPNLCDDMHGSDILALDFTCVTGLTDLKKKGDDWLMANLPVITGSQAYQHAAIFITWDEGELNSDGPIGMIVLSPYAHTAPGGYSNSIPYTHSSTLKTMQEIFGVTPLLGGAADSATTDLSDLFAVFP
jgi:hypothetical protein